MISRFVPQTLKSLSKNIYSNCSRGSSSLLLNSNNKYNINQSYYISNLFTLNNQVNSNIQGIREFFFKNYSSEHTDYKFTQDDEVFQEIKDYKTYEKKGNYSAAKSILNRSLQMVESTVGKKHPITINVLFRMINLEIQIGELASAIRYCQMVLARIDNQLESEYILPTLNFLVLCYQYQGDYQMCFQTIDKLISIAREKKDWEVVVGTILNKAIIQALNCQDEAEQSFKEALDQFKQHLDIINHPLYETILGNYATHMHSLGEHDELAKQLYQQAMQLAEQHNNQSELVHILTNYCEFLYDSGCTLEQAENTINNAINKAEQLYGRNNSKVGSLLFILGRLHRDKNNQTFAEGFFNKCITIFEDYKNETLRKATLEKMENESKDAHYKYLPGKRELELRNNKEVDIDFGNVLWEYAQMMREQNRLKEAYNLEQRARHLNAIEDDQDFIPKDQEK
ncbi:hypothetical protein CYY_001473 [Polysphondylium violaceum]|uniref:Anaphase-promoting complex subunit 5 domain-containing protein n=1 Tax=Polysphondylium violaceum TaxID=133409 RepID=A0A8J4VAJ7_9MYCE|nr:hypothetical protein CYY_001473 [Polysphondylium violaceum]